MVKVVRRGLAMDCRWTSAPIPTCWLERDFDETSVWLTWRATGCEETTLPCMHPMTSQGVPGRMTFWSRDQMLVGRHVDRDATESATRDSRLVMHPLPLPTARPPTASTTPPTR